MSIDPRRLAAAAAGDSEAMIELVLIEGRDLRLFIAAHLHELSQVTAVEQATWTTARRQLPLRDTGVSLGEWLRWVAVERIDRHLKGLNLLGTDEITRLTVQDCLESIASRQDHDVADAAGRLEGASAGTQELLRRRYGENESLDQIAVGCGESMDTVAAALAAARSTCDWRRGMPTMGDRLLPRLVEDWFAGRIDSASRALLMQKVTLSPAQAAAIVRQVRLHVVLSVLFQPFGLREATAVSRITVKPSEARDRDSSFRGRGVPRTVDAMEQGPQRISSSPSTVIVLPVVPFRIPLSVVIGGIVVLIGIVVFLVHGRSGSRPPQVAASPASEEQSLPPPEPAVQPHAVSQASSPLRPQFGGVSNAVSSAGSPVLKWTGQALHGIAYVGESMRLEVDISGIDDLGAVEFSFGDRTLATISRAPYVWEWRDLRPAVGNLSARALSRNGTVLLSASAPLRIQVAQGTGRVLREWWVNMGGRSVAESLNYQGILDRPYGVTFETSLNAPRDWGDNYFQRLRGYVIPPQSGLYTFWIAGDDEAELRLSTDSRFTVLRQIARCEASSKPSVAPEAWDERPEQRSEPIALEANRRYYFEVLHKESTGSDHVAVGWQLPDGTMERPIPGKRLSPPVDETKPLGFGSLVFVTDFETLPLGPIASYFAVSGDPAVPGATGYVTDGDAASGRRFLAIHDAPGQRFPWTPEIFRRNDYRNGMLRISAALRMHSGATLEFSSRHYKPDGKMVFGPRFAIAGTGAVMFGDRVLARPLLDTWFRFTVTTGLGTRTDGKWSIAVTPATGPTQEVKDLPCQPGFTILHQINFASMSKTTAIFDIDMVTMHLE